ncbi:Rv2578c family radical SAM protein [soil metagenome]
MFYSQRMRWDSQLLEPPKGETVKLALFGEDAVIRRFNTPEFKGMTFYEVRSKSIINHVKANNMGFSWTINPYRGCSHACSYCFARPTHTYLDLNAGADFETKIVVKVNAVELLRRELRKPSWAGEHIAMGTNTDNYQRAEGRYRLMRGILKELNANRNPYSILTKSTLIQRDLELLAEGAAVTDVSACFSVGTVDEQVWRKTEPGTPHPLKRLEVLSKLNKAGVPCGILMAPILPGISDSPAQLAATVQAAAKAGAVNIAPLILHLRPGVKEEFLPWLETEYPELLGEYRRMYRGSNAPKSVAEPIQKAVHALKDRHGPKTGLRHRAPMKQMKAPEPQPEAEQMSLDCHPPPNGAKAARRRDA